MMRKYKSPLAVLREKERKEKALEARMRAEFPDFDRLRAENIERIKKEREKKRTEQ